MSATATHGSVKTFGKGGIHPGPNKGMTSGKPIEDIPPPKEVRLPLVQHLGEPATMIVKKGDLVRRGQKIADGGATGAPLHATISGKVKPLDRYPHPTLVMSQAIVITRTEGEGTEELEFPEDPAWRGVSREEALERIREAGIVGLGGAAFPTFRKLTLPEGVKLDTLILNGAECEPYLTSDYRIMLAHPVEIVEGAMVMARILGVKRAIIGVESDKPEAAAKLEAAAAGAERGDVKIEVGMCQARYPQGAERQLVHALTGRVMPARALPSAVRVLVQNVATAVAVHDAVRYRKPLLDRVVTVTGPGIREPKNVRVPIGTLLADLVAFGGGFHKGVTRVVAGGPMMGRSLPRLDIPVIKGLNGLVLLTGVSPFEGGYGPCIGCTRCVEACPLGLEPDQVSVRVEAGRQLETEPFGAIDCYECGCCTYVCPSSRPLVQFMQVAKASLRRAGELRIRK
ncbi:MAG: electron transport complex subunit RsxC [Candidatus Eisenbacteria bacterium]|nr:electron transport complex subunit RsxC [Candidatus Eisenbacteria bacterium]